MHSFGHISNFLSFLVFLFIIRPQLKFEKIKGVARCVVGYSGGKMKNPTYKNIMDHTEASLVEFDPAILPYESLVISWTQMHTPMYNGNCQYRSAVWYLNEDQKEIAEEVVKGWKSSIKGQLFTNIEPATSFYRAEEYHQNFLRKSIER